MRTPDKFDRLARARRIRGQGMTEYIIIVCLIAIGAVSAIGYFGTTVNASFVSMGSALTGGDNGNAATANTAAGAQNTTDKTVLGTYETTDAAE